MASQIIAGNATNSGIQVGGDNTGVLELVTGSGSGTAALTIDASQNATFAGDADIAGDLTVTGTISSTSGDLTLPGAVSVGGNLSFNSGYGSAGLAYGCRAWVNCDGINNGTFAGGTSTVTRVAGSTTATVTTTTAHGLITGNFVYAATGVATGLYTVTRISDTSFSFTTVATTALTAASITFTVSTIRGSGRISSVAHSATGQYAVNFSSLMPDANYAVTATANSGTPFSAVDNWTVQPRNFTTAGFYCQVTDATSNTYQDADILSLAIFR